jgi:hypothetical protein
LEHHKLLADKYGFGKDHAGKKRMYKDPYGNQPAVTATVADKSTGGAGAADKIDFCWFCATIGRAQKDQL